MKKGFFSILFLTISIKGTLACIDIDNGTIGSRVGFTLFYEDGQTEWMDIFIEQLEKWNNLYSVFYIEDSVLVSNNTEIQNSTAKNKVYWGYRGYPAESFTKPKDQNGRLHGGDIVFHKNAYNTFSFSPHIQGNCNIGVTEPRYVGIQQNYNPNLTQTFEQLALHELSHFIGLCHTSADNITNVNISRDAALSAFDKKLWHKISVENFNRNADHRDFGVFRGVDTRTINNDYSLIQCPHLSILGKIKAFKRGAKIRLTNCTVANLSDKSYSFFVLFYIEGPNRTSNRYLLQFRRYIFKPFSEERGPITFNLNYTLSPGNYKLRALILNSDTDPSNDQVVLVNFRVRR